MNSAYGEIVTAEEVFDCILCLLSATSYSLRFAEDLEDVFPHVPFPATIGVFREAARIGTEIRMVETFSRPPVERETAFCRLATTPSGALTAVEYKDESITFCENGTGIVTGLPEEVWSFAVSGYRLLPRWLEARIGTPVNLAFAREFTDICGRIAELIELFGQADTVLESTLANTLSREALGFDESQ